MSADSQGTPLTVEALAGMIMPKLTDIADTTRRFSHQLTAVETEVKQLRNTVTQQAKTITRLEEKIDLLQDEIRKPNILFHGIPEDDEEDVNPSKLYATVYDLLQKMGVKADIDNPFRSRKNRTAGKIRPVKVHILLPSHKSRILMAKKRIEALGQNMYITEDLSLSTRKKRKEYYEQNLAAGSSHSQQGPRPTQ
jgi:chromosome segregation ATPase